MIQSDGKTRGTASDSKYSRGLVAVSGVRIWDIEVRGTVEETHLRALVASYYEKRFREWLDKSWNRDAVIPAWTRGASPGRSPAAHSLLPGDAPTPPPPGMADAMEEWRKGEYGEFLARTDSLRDLPSRTAVFIGALRDMALGRNARAKEALDRLLEEEPDCSGALLHRGIIRLHLRDLEGAAADLEGARSGAASMPSLYLALATLALQEGDLERAHAHLGDAKVAGAWTPSLERLARWVQRSREGPQWPRKYEERNRNTVVASDHSLELCREVARLLERSYLAYTGVFPKTARPKAPLRVWVFSNRDAYLRYAADLGRDLEKTAGAYIASVGEMVLFVPDIARADFRATVKHEAFHAFLDCLVEDAPTWFDEGFAQWFESVEVTGGAVAPAEVRPIGRVALWALAAAAPATLKALLLMDHATFMQSADLHYEESRALVQYLFECKDPPGKHILMEYLGSLRAGITKEEAFQKHFEPRLTALQSGLAAWIHSRLGERTDK